MRKGVLQNQRDRDDRKIFFWGGGGEIEIHDFGIVG